MENHHFWWVNPLFLCPFSIAMWLFTRGYLPIILLANQAKRTSTSHQHPAPIPGPRCCLAGWEALGNWETNCNSCWGEAWTGRLYGWSYWDVNHKKIITLKLWPNIATEPYPHRKVAKETWPNDGQNRSINSPTMPVVWCKILQQVELSMVWQHVTGHHIYQYPVRVYDTVN